MFSDALGGAIVTVTTGAGGVASWSLHAPKVLGAGPLQVPFAARASEAPSGSVPASATPISTEVAPSAGPSVAANTPSYDRNSTTAPPASTSAMPSGAPFWIPLLG